MDERLIAYLDICRAICERRIRDGTWPWPVDSTNPEDMIDSESITNDDL